MAAAGDGAADGLNRRGVVGLEQQRAADPLRKLIVGGAVIKGAVVAFQGVEIGGSESQTSTTAPVRLSIVTLLRVSSISPCRV